MNKTTRKCNCCGVWRSVGRYYRDDPTRRCESICKDCYDTKEIELLYLRNEIVGGCYESSPKR